MLFFFSEPFHEEEIHQKPLDNNIYNQNQHEYQNKKQYNADKNTFKNFYHNNKKVILLSHSSKNFDKVSTYMTTPPPPPQSHQKIFLAFYIPLENNKD